jgi:Xaa-Pro dipeptidase
MTETTNALPFAATEYEDRMARLRACMAALSLDGMVTFVQENQYWLTGYETTGFHSFPQGLIVTAAGAKLLVTRQLEIENATDSAYALPAVGYWDDEDPGVAIAKGLADMGLSSGRVGLEKRTPWVTIQVYEAIRAGAPKMDIVDVSGTIELLRSVKSAAEVGYMRRAAKAVGAAMNAGIAAVREGATEFDVAAEVSHARIAAGSHFTRNPSYIVSGPRSALGHASWIGRTLEAGDVVFFELGANVRRYDSALIRCATVGPATDAMKRAADASLSAIESMLAALRPGAVAKDLHAVAQATFDGRGYGDLFDHRAGYGIGIEFLTWIERGGLSLDPGSEQVIEAGMTVHLIPFFKTPGQYSIGASETVLVTADSPEVLETGCERRLHEC